jgi:protein TonB
VRHGTNAVIAAPIELGGAASRTAATMISAVFSIVLHGSIAAAVFLWFEPRPGAVAMHTDSISVELVASEVVEAAQPEQTKATAAPSSTAQAETGSAEAAPEQSEPTETERAEDASEARAKEVIVARIDDAPPPTPEAIPASSDEIAIVQPERPLQEAHPQKAPAIERKDPEVAPKPAKRADEQRSAKPKREPMRKGGTPSRSNAGSAPSSSRVSASTGAAINYASRVRAHVTARRPSGTGAHGTVVISFGVLRSGGLSFARIARSSGDAGLDRNVLTAVRGAAPFPVPPSGATPVQMRFDMPFYFR